MWRKCSGFGRYGQKAHLHVTVEMSAVILEKGNMSDSAFTALFVHINMQQASLRWTKLPSRRIFVF